MTKKTAVVVFGGRSSEHEVSCVSATTIIQHINREKYDVCLIGITKEGRWLWVDDVAQIQDGSWYQSSQSAVISPDAGERVILKLVGDQVERIPVDVAFPAMHGLFGEDGTIQGLFELALIPYVGCGVLASAVSMDKWYTKIVVDTLGIRQAQYVPVAKAELADMDAAIAKVEAKLPYPVFVKPSNAGSSCGVSKAANRTELEAALLLAAEHDRKILVEETIVGRELECAVLGGLQPKASGIGEILAAAEFYDYEAKYHNAESKTVISPELPEGIEEQIRDAAVRIFRAVDGYGLSRVDFFLEEKSGQIVFNEINTLPGFTGISMYPMLWEARGIGKDVLVEKLLEQALARYEVL